MIFLDDITQWDSRWKPVMESARKVRIHKDVISLAYLLAIDAHKLAGASRFIFWPAEQTWIEWEDDNGKMGFYFSGDRGSVGIGLGSFWHMRHGDTPHPTPCHIDTPNYGLSFSSEKTKNKLLEMYGNTPLRGKIIDTYGDWSLTQQVQTQANLETIKPVIWAILALINSPKIVRKRSIDQSRLNKRRTALGRYTFHPHHEVRLNVDKHIIDTVAGTGDGASKALHFVRAFLRFRLGQYELVRPHWRGDPALGIRDTHYAVDRQNSKWKD